MQIQRRTVLLALGLAACATSARTSSNRSLAEVIARHTQARGGAATLDAVRNTLNVAEITEPTFQILGRYIASTEGRMRVDVFHNGQRAFSEGIDAAGAWNWESGGATPKDASPTAAAALAHGVEFNLFGLHALPQRGHTVTLEGRELIAGIDYYKIKLQLADGFETWRYINPQTWMIDRARDLRALHPDVDPTQVIIESEYSDFRAVDGVMTAFRWVQRNAATGETMQTGILQRLDYNVGAEQLNCPRGAPVFGVYAQINASSSTHGPHAHTRR